MPKRKMKRATLADGTDHARLRALRVGCEQYIAEREWDYFCTLTFRFEVTEVEAVREFEQRFIQRSQQRSQGRVDYFAVAARNFSEGRVHVHALLKFVRPLASASTANAWVAGQANVRSFHRRGGAAGYIAQHIALPTAETMVRWRDPMHSPAQ